MQPHSQNGAKFRRPTFLSDITIEPVIIISIQLHTGCSRKKKRKKEKREKRKTERKEKGEKGSMPDPM